MLVGPHPRRSAPAFQFGLHDRRFVSRAWSGDRSAVAVIRSHVAHHLPRPIRRQSAPARTPDTRPPGNPASNAPGRTATDGHSRAAGTAEPRASARASVLSMRLEPLGQPVSRTSSTGPSPNGGSPRAVDSPPDAASARRIAARHANRQSQRRKHGPYPLPRPAPGLAAAGAAAGGAASARRRRAFAGEAAAAGAYASDVEDWLQSARVCGRRRGEGPGRCAARPSIL